jgi:hypothetical protein
MPGHALCDLDATAVGEVIAMRPDPFVGVAPTQTKRAQHMED